PWHTGITSRSAGDPEAVARAAEMLLAADRPVIVAGNGVAMAEADVELRSLAELLDIPVATTPLGKGAIDERHRLSVGPTGRNGTYACNQATRTADVILALGTRFDDRATSAWLPGFTYSIPPTKLIHVEIDPQELGRNYPPTIGILGDVRSVLRQLLELVRSRAAEARAHHQAFLKEVEGWKAEWESFLAPARISEAVPIRPDRLVADLRAVLPEESIVLADVGIHHNWLVEQWATYRPQSLLQSWGFASMGFAVAGVLGAKLAAPERPVVAVCGDGGFLMFNNAVATAVEYDLPVVWVVWNNLGYVSIRDQQAGFFGQGRELAVRFRKDRTGDFLSPDYAALARAMGADGMTVTRPGDLKEQVAAALECGRPCVLDVRVDADVRPPATGSWDLPPLPAPLPNYGWTE
ncbi:MAG: thiamine pyrophosphate-binding protein, partial [Chloroflexota bacterium]